MPVDTESGPPSSCSSRLTRIALHLSSSATNGVTASGGGIGGVATSAPGTKKHKVVVCRDLGPDVMPMLRARPELDVVLWPENRNCDREWLLENIVGASGVVVLLSEKVSHEQ